MVFDSCCADRCSHCIVVCLILCHNRRGLVPAGPLWEHSPLLQDFLRLCADGVLRDVAKGAQGVTDRARRCAATAVGDAGCVLGREGGGGGGGSGKKRKEEGGSVIKTRMSNVFVAYLHVSNPHAEMRLTLGPQQQHPQQHEQQKHPRSCRARQPAGKLQHQLQTCSSRATFWLLLY